MAAAALFAVEELNACPMEVWRYGVVLALSRLLRVRVIIGTCQAARPASDPRNSNAQRRVVYAVCGPEVWHVAGRCQKAPVRHGRGNE